MNGRQSAVFRRDESLPPISRWLFRGFTGYIAYYVRKHFQGLHLLHSAKAGSLEGWPLLICVNHPSWWDPLFAIYLSQLFFSSREHRGPIAAAGLAKFQFFERLGFFGIDPDTREGAAEFLRVGRAMLRRPDAAFWVSAQGQFTDVRIRPVTLQAGVAHLARSCPRFVMLPIAFEYAFWNERKPEAFVGVGDPLFIQDGQRRPTAEWLQVFSESLDRTQATLSEHVMARDAGAFETVFHGKSRVGGVYDLWQALKSIAGSKPLPSETRRSIP